MNYHAEFVQTFKELLFLFGLSKGIKKEIERLDQQAFFGFRLA